jgi:hypothetical protein
MLRIVAVSVAWASVGYRLLVLRADSTRSSRTLLAIVMLPAIAATAALPPVYFWLGAASGLPNVGVLLATSFGLLTLVPCLNLLLLRSENAEDRRRRGRHRYWAALLLLAVQVWLWAGVSGPPADPLFGLTRATEPQAVAYLMVHQMALAATGVVCVVQCDRTARKTQGLARWGLRAVEASGLLAFVVVVINSGYYVSVLLGGPVRDDGLGLLSVWMVYLSVLALAVGVTVPDWAPRLVTLVNGFRRLRAVEPAWQTMVLAVPEVHLDAGYRSWDVDRRLHRRVVEIHDAELALRDQPLVNETSASGAALERAQRLAVAVRREEAGLQAQEADSLVSEVAALVRAAESINLRRAPLRQRW